MADYRNKHKKENEVSRGAFGLLEKGIESILSKIFGRGGGFATYKPGEITRIWDGIEKMEPKLSIIEADKLVDNVLRRAHVKGKAMGERLRSVEKMVPYDVYSDMWEAHKERNRLVHEARHDDVVSNHQQVLWRMKKFLVALGAFRNE